MQKKIFFILLAAALFTGHITRAQEVIDEDVIDNLAEKAEPLWSDNDANIKDNTIPAKWNDESAVILLMKRHLIFDREEKLLSRKKLEITEKRRFKIKLIDANAVKTFSTLFFRYTNKNDGFGVKIYKPEGTAEDVSLAKAINVETNDEIPEFFLGFFDKQHRDKSNYYKVPVAGLQQGDILEFVSVIINNIDVTPFSASIFYGGSSVYNFEDQYEYCNKPYPVQVNKLIIESDKNTYLSCRSLNGAPDFNIKQDKDFDVYTWKDENRDRVKDVNFLNERQVLPMIKFTLTYASNFNPKNLFIGEAGQLKNEFKPEEIVEKARVIFSKTKESSVGYYIAHPLKYWSEYIWKAFKKNDIDELPDADYLRYCYYSLRYMIHNKGTTMNNLEFIFILSGLLDKKKIPYDILITSPNTVSTLKDIISEKELLWLLKANNTYFYYPGPNTQMQFKNYFYAGNQALKIPFLKDQQMALIKIDEAKVDDNYAKEELNVSFDPAVKKYTISKTGAYQGIYNDQIYNTAAWGANAFKLNGYCTSDVAEKLMPDEKTMSKDEDEYNEKKKDYEKKIKENFEKLEQSNFPDTVKLTKGEILQLGNCYKNPELKYRSEFTVNAHMLKAGKKLFINLPALIGNQLQLKTEERTRQYDADVTNPRKLSWRINFTVPAGYEVDGLQNLNFTVNNEIGSFTSTAVLNGNLATIDINKTYKERNIPKEKWDKLVKFVDAAYTFSQKMILLRPK
ncbi:MAG: hypothetical protein JST86_04360 [Bacteroidetes bacterium]|nr:hypothetical protein [Bacteroidota bacterium]